MKELLDKLNELKDGLSAEMDIKAKEIFGKEIKKLEAKLAEIEGKMDTKTLSESIDTLKASFEAMVAKAAENQAAIDKFSIHINRGGEPAQKKTFGEVFSEAIEKNATEISKVTKGRSFKMDIDLKAVGNMTLSSSLTGTSVLSRGTDAFLPGTQINFRDLIPTVQSDTLVRGYYKETGSEGSISKQTEGSSKSQIDYDLTEVKTVTSYVAGFAKFSKQLMKALPFLQGTLPRLLMRDFYTKENDLFYAAVAAAATGSTTTTETDDIKQIIDYIANQRTAKFAASYVLGNHKQIAALNKLTYTSGYYEGSGGVLTRPDGSMAISGVTTFGVDWVEDDKILIFDSSYLERVEAESLTIEFFEQDSDNVQKNLITARIECLEEINPMFAQSIILADMGNIA